MKILILGDYNYAAPWLATFPGCNITTNNTYLGTTKPVDVGNYDAVQFTGGHDVSPALYGQPNTYREFGANCHQQRDLYESYIFRAALDERVPCLGICRGSQFLRAMCGGTLVQDIEGHLGNHMAQVRMSVEHPDIEVTSTHHQKAVPDNVRFEDVLTADEGAVVEGWIWVDDPCVAAVQYHPEYMNEESDGFKFYQDLIRATCGYAQHTYDLWRFNR